MDRKIIHIGLHKTGTTFLQKEIFPLLDLDIVSYEDLSGIPQILNFPVKFRYNLIPILKKITPDAIILIGWRDQKEWVNSLYNEYVKLGGTLKIDDYIKELDKEWLNFEKYRKLLKKHFHVLEYHYDKDIDKMVAEVCDLLKVDVPNYKGRIINKKHSRKELESMRKFNIKLPVKNIRKLGGRTIFKIVKILSIFKWLAIIVLFALYIISIIIYGFVMFINALKETNKDICNECNGKT